MDELAVRRAVREHYAGRAEPSCGDSEDACCGPSLIPPGALAGGLTSSIPSLGVGDTIAVLAPKTGETVLDLGSGPGRDVLRAAELVGASGQAIGVDATPEMVYRARESARALGRPNAEFRLGEIEHLPLPSGSVDGILSDCVVNLSPDKAQVFREAFRVLRPGGRIVISDLVADGELPRAIRDNPDQWAACVAGAVPESTYITLLREAGFVDVRSEKRGTDVPILARATVLARKPPAPA